MIFVVISIIIGLKIAAKYFKIKKQEFLLIGIFWIGLTTPWWPNVITFILILLLNIPVNIENFVILGIALLPPTIILGLYSFTKLLSIENRTRKFILTIVGIPNLIVEILFIYFVFVDLSFIATYSGIFSVEWSLFSQIYFIVSLAIFLTVGVLFSRESLRSDNSEIHLKGKLLLIAFISFVVGTTLDFAFASTITYVIARLILVSSSLEFYMGFILPEWAKNLLLKKK